MLRVWGGGPFYLKAFMTPAMNSVQYPTLPRPNVCRRAESRIYTELLDHIGSHDVKDEIIHFVRKLSARPSIVLRSGCNECTYGGWSMDVYKSFLLQTIACGDDTRAVWPSSPSAFGWKTGVCTLDGRPNGNPLQVQNDTGSTLETHGPYQRVLFRVWGFCFFFLRFHIRSATREQLECTRWKPTRLLRAANWSS
jgi:hypothetical protein